MRKRLISQGTPFQWTEDNKVKAQTLMAPYPAGRQASALIPLLDLAQRQNGGWLSQECVEYVCSFLDVTLMQGYEVASFYSMFNLQPVGRYFLQVCTTTPCQLRGALAVLDACNQTAGVAQGQVSTDGLFSVCEVECLGACIDAPVVQINDDYWENLDPQKMKKILGDLRAKDRLSERNLRQEVNDAG